MVTLVASYPKYSSNTSKTQTLTTASFTAVAGELLVLKIQGENGTVQFGTPSGGGPTWTQQALGDLSGDYTYGAIWTATATGGTTTVSATRTNTTIAGYCSLVLERWSEAKLDSTMPQTAEVKASGAPLASITTAGDSAITWLSGDWNATAPAGHAYRSGAVEDGFQDRSPNAYVAYYATQQASAAGAQTLGLTSPAGQKYSILALEILNNASGPAPTEWLAYGTPVAWNATTTVIL